VLSGKKFIVNGTNDASDLFPRFFSLLIFLSFVSLVCVFETNIQEAMMSSEEVNCSRLVS
jgi:hypothetical protein